MKAIASCKRCGFCTTFPIADAAVWSDSHCQNCYGPLKIYSLTVCVGF